VLNKLTFKKIRVVFGDLLDSLLLISGLTVFMAGVGANFEYDLLYLL
jgi:uncharacterized protein (DUF1810 family)